MIAIFGALMALLLSSIQSARETARRAQCANNLKQIGLAVHSYEATSSYLPSNGQFNFDSYSVHARILPYVDQAALYQQINLAAAANSQPTVTRQRVALYLCPDEINDRAASSARRHPRVGRARQCRRWPGRPGPPARADLGPRPGPRRSRHADRRPQPPLRAALTRYNFGNERTRPVGGARGSPPGGGHRRRVGTGAGRPTPLSGRRPARFVLAPACRRGRRGA